jgi:diadenosine tetraphosphate (Ap4A) HIT family hydrolase
MSGAGTACTLCLGALGDEQLGRVQVWEDRLWRLMTTRSGTVAGFSYLEPKRHIPHITDLDGDEARTFGEVIARASTVLKEVTGAELVYVYVFGGGIPHLHVHLAPHRRGDSLNDSLVRGEVEYEPLPSGATRIVSKDFPTLPEAEHQAVIHRLRQQLQAD